MRELDWAIEGLYAVFARYPRPAKIESCPCGCTKPGSTDHLLAVPLRDLKLSALEDYCFSALTTQGSAEDFSYLLPRLLEAITRETVECNVEILFGKLRYANWMEWPQDEVIGIRGYLHALWSEALTTFPIIESMPALLEIETVLSCIAQTGEPMDYYLRAWNDAKATQADEHLIQFVTMCGADFVDGRTLHGGFWERSKPQADALRKWLIDPERLKRIERSACLLREDGFEHLFLPALEALQRESAHIHQTASR